MKTIKLIATAAFASLVFYQAQQKQETITDVSLDKVETFAQTESGQENIFDYSVWENSECYVYVGGAYAKGQKVTCISGKSHPVCSECKL